MDDKDFFAVRKNLNILSVLILVLAYANAEIHDLNFLGIQLELEGSKLYVGLFIIYLYFIWRYLTKMPLMSGFWNDFNQYYMDSEKGVKREHNFEKYQNMLLQNSEELRNNSDAQIVDQKIIKFSSKILRKLRLSVTFYRSRREVDNEKINHDNFSAVHDFHVSRIYVLRKLLVFSFKHDKFGDYVFPLIPIIINLLFLHS